MCADGSLLVCRFLLGAAGLALACVLVVAVSSYTAQRATALLQQKLAPTDTWIGHTLNSQGYKFDLFGDHNDRTPGKAEPWSEHVCLDPPPQSPPPIPSLLREKVEEECKGGGERYRIEDGLVGSTDG